jgi:hypothetical protein
MLRVRPEQLHAFQEPLRRAYEDRLVLHVQQFFPERCAEVGKAGVRAEVRSGVDRAALHGITTERDVCKFVSLVFVFGPEFDVKLSWARKMLALPEGGEPGVRMQRLYAEASARMPRPKGAPDGE